MQQKRGNPAEAIDGLPATVGGMTSKPGSASGPALVNVAVLFFGLAGVLGKMSHLPSPLIVFGRAAVAGVALLGVAVLRRLPVRPHSHADILVLVGQGAVLAAHWTMFFQSIAVSNVAIGLLSYSAFPLFTVALEALLLRQAMSGSQLIAALFIIPGVALLVPSFTLESGTTQGVLWGLGAGASFAVLAVVNRHLTRRYPSIAISLYQDGVAALALTPALLLLPHDGLFTPRADAPSAARSRLHGARAHLLHRRPPDDHRATREPLRVARTGLGHPLRAAPARRNPDGTDVHRRGNHRGRNPPTHHARTRPTEPDDPKLSALAWDDVAPRISGDAAVATSRPTQAGTYKGRDIVGRFRVTRVLVNGDGQWLLAALHRSPIAEGAPCAFTARRRDRR